MRSTTSEIREHRLVLLAALAVAAWGLCGTGFAAEKPPAKPAPHPGAKAAPSAAPGIADRIRDQIQALTFERGDARAKRRALEMEIRARCSLSPENVRPVMLGLERDRFALQTGVEVDRVRLDLLRSRVADAAAQAAKPAPPDPVAEGLKKIVAARRTARDMVRTAVATASAPRAEFDRAEADLAEAEIRLALRKEETAKSQTDGEKERLNRQLRELSAQLMLDEVRLRGLDSRLHMLHGALDLVDDYNDATGRIASIDREIEQDHARQLRAALGLPHEQ